MGPVPDIEEGGEIDAEKLRVGNVKIPGERV
jgi:hypothetical protein